MGGQIDAAKGMFERLFMSISAGPASGAMGRLVKQVTAFLDPEGSSGKRLLAVFNSIASGATSVLASLQGGTLGSILNGLLAAFEKLQPIASGFFGGFSEGFGEAFRTVRSCSPRSRLAQVRLSISSASRRPSLSLRLLRRWTWLRDRASVCRRRRHRSWWFSASVRPSLTSSARSPSSLPSSARPVSRLPWTSSKVLSTASLAAWSRSSARSRLSARLPSMASKACSDSVAVARHGGGRRVRCRWLHARRGRRCSGGNGCRVEHGRARCPRISWCCRRHGRHGQHGRHRHQPDRVDTSNAAHVAEEVAPASRNSFRSSCSVSPVRAGVAPAAV